MIDNMDGKEFKKKFAGKIAWVNLIWTWGYEKYSETDYKAVFQNGDKRDIVVSWDVVIKDPEYSFNGSPEKAMEFMDSYDLWDDLEESDIHDMILEKTYSGYDPDSSVPPYELKDSDFKNCMSIDCNGLCIWVDGERLVSIDTMDDIVKIYKQCKESSNVECESLDCTDCAYYKELCEISKENMDEIKYHLKNDE